jgi:homogentisate 1,2-dioxygenase
MGVYTCNTSMENEAFFDSDGDILIVPQLGRLSIMTEFGLLEVEPWEFIVIQRGIKFAVSVEGESRGYYTEVFDGHFVIPDLGPIGTNGNANARDFEVPKAKYFDDETEMKVIQKYLGKFFQYTIPHNVFDIVAWHGNYYPYKYDCHHFNVMGSVSFDHPDPSIFTVLTCQTTDPGLAACDFAIFAPRWLTMENTFRPPYFHRNTMNEFMGNIAGSYDAKEKGFIPGAASLHSCMSAHGPEAEVVEKASTVDLKPQKVGEGCLAFMFET